MSAALDWLKAAVTATRQLWKKILGRLPPRSALRSRRTPVAAVAVASALLILLWLAAVSDRPTEQTVEVDLPPAAAPPQPAVAPADTAPLARVAQQLPSSKPAEATDPVALARPDPANSLSVPAVTAAAFAAIPLAAAEAALSPAPDPALVEDSASGPLPKRGADGRVAWRVYARPFAVNDDRPRIAVIVAGLGLSPTATREMIQRLPGAVTFAFEASAADVYDWAQAARAGGHEILLGLPLQGDAFPFVDAGPDALAPDLSPEQNRERLTALLARMTGYVGVLTAGGGEADGGDGASDGDQGGAFAAIDADLAARGLLVVDERSAVRGAGSVEEESAPRIRSDVAVSADDSIAAIRARLALLEALARSRSYAVAVVEPSPAAVAELAAWSVTLAGKDLVLAPVSAVAATVDGTVDGTAARAQE